MPKNRCGDAANPNTELLIVKGDLTCPDHRKMAPKRGRAGQRTPGKGFDRLVGRHRFSLSFGSKSKQKFAKSRAMKRRQRPDRRIQVKPMTRTIFIEIQCAV